VVPAFNETDRLPRTLDALRNIVRNRDIELIVVDDGSTDGTADLARRILTYEENASVIRLPRNRGKGYAVRAGVARARGSAIMFMDADLATDLSSLPAVVGALERAEIAVGSRSKAGAVVVGASTKRTLMGRGFNTFARAVTGVSSRDTQCGFKAFRSGPGKLLFALSRVDRFAFDVELLVLGRMLGYRAEEVPVNWTQQPGTKVSTVRDSLAAVRDVVRTRARRSPLDRSIVSVSVRDSARSGSSRELPAMLRTLLRHGDIVIDTDRAAVALLPLCSDEVGRSVATRLRRKYADLAAAAGRTPAQVIRTFGSACSEEHWVRPSLP
jgi:dolichyl-phosphate beta-glucosyltransferase